MNDIPAAAELYVWGYPLLAVHRTRQLFCSRSKTGLINHVDNLATPKDKGVVAPNNDTLYSSGWYDLTLGDLSIDVPAMDHKDRYWNVMILDAYTHVAYVCRRYHGVSATKVKVTYDPTTPPANDDSDVVTIGTPTAWVIVRMLVESDEDLEQARSLQRAIEVTAPEGHPQDLTERAGRPTDIHKAGVGFYKELKNFVERDPPADWHPQLSSEAKAILENPESFPDELLLDGIEQGEKLISGNNSRGNLIKNGWSTGKNATDFGADPVKRATGAKFGLGGHQAIENRSYIAHADAENRKLDGNQALVIRLSGDDMPPCNGFWSLTAYGMDLYLVENEIDRWSIGDRTPGLKFEADGSLVIVLSAKRPRDVNNWLPVPPGPYMMGMRVYEGHPEVVTGEWFPPELEPIEL